MLINTCSDLVTNMSNLQKRMVSNEAREQERLNQSWANLSNAAQGKVPNSQGAPPAAAIHAALQQDTNNTVLQGSCNKQALKYGRDRIGGSDHSRIFVKWPHEACFIGPSRIRVRYDELNQA